MSVKELILALDVKDTKFCALVEIADSYWYELEALKNAITEPKGPNVAYTPLEMVKLDYIARKQAWITNLLKE